MNADGMRAIIHGMEQTKSFDTKKVSEYLRSMEKPIPGITGPLQFAKDGNRIGSSYMTFEIQADNSYKVVHAQ
jgi:branched-chain amino acid transport system substrate-binding protein